MQLWRTLRGAHWKPDEVWTQKWFVRRRKRSRHLTNITGQITETTRVTVGDWSARLRQGIIPTTTGAIATRVGAAALISQCTRNATFAASIRGDITMRLNTITTTDKNRRWIATEITVVRPKIEQRAVVQMPGTGWKLHCTMARSTVEFTVIRSVTRMRNRIICKI